jgi:hypothetical protein
MPEPEGLPLELEMVLVDEGAATFLMLQTL